MTADWQPMETAPKDRRILAQRHGEGTTIVWWQPDIREWKRAGKSRPRWAGEGFLERQTVWARDNPPLRWMELPK